MILSGPYLQWIYIQPSNPLLPYRGQYTFPKTKEECLEHWGKWAVFGDRDYLDNLARQLDSYVEKRRIYNIKYLRQPPAWLGFDQVFMCIYCDDRENEVKWQILAKFGVTQKLWAYERETTALWMPGGLFFEIMIAHRKLSQEESEDVGEKFQKWNEEYLSNIFEKNEKDFSVWNYELFLLKQAKEESAK